MMNSVSAQNAYNPIVFAMPVLTVVPDARASGMGDMGVATLPTSNDQHWNAAKYVFNEAKSGLSLSYIPWLRNVGSNINLLYLTGFYRLDNKQAIGASLRYFSLGSMTFWGDQQEFIKSSNPNEMELDVSYSRLLGEYFSAGVTFRYLRSDIAGGYYSDASTILEPANAWSADIGFYYNEPVRIGAMTGIVSAGVSITNIGSKMNYGNYNSDKPEFNTYFLPTTGRIGGNLKLDLDYYNELSFGVEVSKYLVPTPPTMKGDTIISGKDNNVSVPMGMIQSFYDAPGGFGEEIKEFMIGVGAEYTYARMFSARGGYCHDVKWPNHRYATMGVGIIYYMYSFDVSYLVPVVSGLQSPLANTLRLTLSIDFGKSMTRRTFANN
jgi:hypothetical protein